MHFLEFKISFIFFVLAKLWLLQSFDPVLNDIINSSSFYLMIPNEHLQYVGIVQLWIWMWIWPPHLQQ